MNKYFANIDIKKCIWIKITFQSDSISLFICNWFITQLQPKCNAINGTNNIE